MISMRLIYLCFFVVLLTSLSLVSSIHAAVHERQKLARNAPRPAEVIPSSGCRMSKVLSLRGGCDGALSAAPLQRRSLSAGSLSPCRYAADGSISCIPPCHQWQGVQWETQTVAPWKWASCFSAEEDDDEVVVVGRGEWWMRAFCCFFCGQWQLISARRRARLKESEREQEAVREIARLFGKVFTIEDELDLSAMMRGAQEGVSRGFNEVRAETLAKIESFLNLPSGYGTGLVGGLLDAISATLGNASLALFPERQAAASVAAAPADGALQRADDSTLYCGSSSRLCDWVPAASSEQQVPLMRQSSADAGLLDESLSLSKKEKECELQARGEGSTTSAGSSQRKLRPPPERDSPPPHTHIASIPPHHILQELAKAAGLHLSNLHKWCLARGSGAPQLPANPAANRKKNATPSSPSSSIAVAEKHKRERETKRQRDSARSRPLLLRGQWLLWGKWSERWPGSNASAGNDSDPWLLPTLEHFLRVSVAVYGWRMLSITDPHAFHAHQGYGLSDLKALSSYSRIPPHHILQHRLRSMTYSPAYAIMLDAATNSVVLAIRGSFEFADVLTDLVAAAVEVYKVEEGDEQPLGRVHAGMLQAARSILAEVRAELEGALEKHPGWRLVICGHSLGAGVAALIVTLLTFCEGQGGLRSVAVMGFCYGCPPVMDQELSQRLKSRVVTCVAGDDVVARLSFYSVKALKSSMLAALKQKLAVKERDIALQAVGATLSEAPHTEEGGVQSGEGGGMGGEAEKNEKHEKNEKNESQGPGPLRNESKGEGAAGGGRGGVGECVDQELAPLVPPGSLFVLRDITAEQPVEAPYSYSYTSSQRSSAARWSWWSGLRLQWWAGSRRTPRECYRMDAVHGLEPMTQILVSERMFIDHFPSVLQRRLLWLRNAARLPPVAPAYSPAYYSS